MANPTDYNYPNIEPTDYIDESLDKILARDNASKSSFRRVETFPIVTEDDLGMKVYLVGRGNFQLISVDPEPYWKQLTTDNRNPAYTDWVQDNYQPLSALLTSLAKLTQASNALMYFNGPNDIQATPLSGFVKNLLAQTDDDGVRTVLGIGDVASLNLPIDGATAIAAGSIPVSAIDDNFKRNMGWSTGDMKLTYKRTADDGWVIANDGSIGNQASGATTRANNDTKDLFYLMWNLPVCEVQTFAGNPSTKTTAAGDWSANKRLILPKILGRSLGVAGSGAGLTTRNLGQSMGTEKVTLTAANVPPHSHGGLRVIGNGHDSWSAGSYPAYTHYKTLAASASTFMETNIGPIHGEGGPSYLDQSKYDLTVITDRDGNPINSTSSSSTSSTVDNMQPTSFVNVMIKL